MWIVMSASAQMPASCMGRYRKVALVKLTEEGTEAYKVGWYPPRIDERLEWLEKIEQLGNFHEGKTPRCAYRRALVEADRLAAKRNQEEQP